jgi:hypothetical protein
MTRELDLDALLSDPLVRLVMASDGIESGDVRQIAQRVRSARTLRVRSDDERAAVRRSRLSAALPDQPVA